MGSPEVCESRKNGGEREGLPGQGIGQSIVAARP
jgi:hypothetical protein